MLKLIYLLMHLVTFINTQETFFKKYAYTKVMSDCLGESVYKEYKQKIYEAKQACDVQASLQTDPLDPLLTTPPFSTFGPFSVSQSGFVSTDDPLFSTSTVSPISPVTGNPFNQVITGTSIRPFSHVSSVSPVSPARRPFGVFRPVGVRRPQLESPRVFPFPIRTFRRKRGLDLTAERLSEARDKAVALLGNFTCILEKLEMVNANLDINYELLAANAFRLPVPGDLKSDLVQAVNYCRDLTRCLPLEKARSPVPHQLQRAIAYIKCEKDARFTACLKHGLRQDVDHFGLSLLPGYSGSSEDLDRLLELLLQSESAYELELL
ncbi:uncharacterized protein LOC122265048 [Penaeus japonicus]|uniref:uncharacterized protein LOC122265048 n=1 Tax=Penaeus japonicus TaxID=27405 RepID=UPI001C715D60|nr:uncharacterized protein LOC122265048 [Penaeus japonicus]